MFLLLALPSLVVVGSALPAVLDAAPPPPVVPAMLKHFELQTGRDVLHHDIGNFGSNVDELKVVSPPPNPNPKPQPHTRSRSA